VEELSKLTGVPAFYIENGIDNLIKREAVIQPTKKSVQTNFLIFDEKVSDYYTESARKAAAVVSEQFYQLSSELTEKVLALNTEPTVRTFDEMLCFFSMMFLNLQLLNIKPGEDDRLPLKYDGNQWVYKGFIGNAEYFLGMGIGITLNEYENGKLAYFCYHFKPFNTRKRLYENELDVIHAVLRKNKLDEGQKEIAAKQIMVGRLVKNDSGEVVSALPLITKEQYDLYTVLSDEIMNGFMPVYTEHINKFMEGYLKLCPKHLMEDARRVSFGISLSVFIEIVDDWIKKGKITIPDGAVCDSLIEM
jgi:hypothetical protein